VVMQQTSISLQTKKLTANAGMTLIELMVSVAIMAVISAGAFQVYSQLQSAHDRVVDKSNTLNQLQRFYSRCSYNNYLIF